MRIFAERTPSELAVAAVFMIGGIGLALALWLPPDPVQAAPPVAILVEGEPLLPDTAPEEARRIARSVLDRPVRFVLSSASAREYTRGSIGARIDLTHLAALIEQARNPRSTLRLEHAKTGATTLDLPVPLSFDHGAVRELLLDLKDELDQSPVPARIDTDSREIIPEQIGRQVDVWATLERIDEAVRSGATEAHVVIHELAPSRTAASLANVQMNVVIGSFDTRYNEAESANDRTHNLRVAGRHIDGLVLAPGEEFDFNERVGERSRANGFRPATVIAGGELVDGVGGGACQVAGTLHAAVFFAGLPILDRNPHSRPSSYIKLGLDAAVSYPNLNFRFRNDLPEPVVLEFKVQDGFVRARVWATEPTRMVSFVRRIDAFRAYDEREEEDPELPTGVQVLAQRGVSGFTVQRWRIVRDVELNQAIRYASTDRYPPTTQIWRIGTGPAAADDYTPPPGDPHSEYRADEYLSMTQGPGIEGILEQRRAGLTGTPGWTERQGFPSATRESAR